jgi:hypothetical protein
MAFQRLFDDPLWGDHCPLVLRWRDDQLELLVDRLKPLLPDNLTDAMRLAVASIARSIVTEKMKTGRAVHYARAKDRYRQPKRYRDADPRFTWHYVTGAMDALRQAGLIEHALGQWYPHNKESVAWATDRLLALARPLVDVSEPRGISTSVETIVLRGRDNTENDYVDTADTVAMREQVRFLNDNLAQLELRHRGQKLDIPIGRRIFNGSLDRGGRFYCHGSSFQNMPTGQRRELQLVVDGTAHPMVETDYSNLHITMAYSEAGEPVPPGDQYSIDGFDRGLVKVALNTLFNAPNTNNGILAIAEELRNNSELRAVSEIRSSDRSSCHGLAKQVVAAILQKHRRIKSYFGSDCGPRFQRLDSDMAIEVMTRMIERAGRCPLPVHDSFLVPEIDADILSRTMIEVASEYGLQLNLKDSKGKRICFASVRSLHPLRLYLPFSDTPIPPLWHVIQSLRLPPPPPPLSFHLEVTSRDLRGWGFLPRDRPQCHGPPALRDPGDASAARNACPKLLI